MQYFRYKQFHGGKDLQKILYKVSVVILADILDINY